MFKYAKGIVLFSIVFVAEPNALRAEEESDIHPYLSSEFFVDLGVYFPDRKVGIQVDGTLSGPHDPIDFNDELGLDISDETFALNFGWRYGKKWELAAQYFESSGSTGAVLEEDIEWGDVIFEQGSSVVAGQGFTLVRAFFARRFESKEQHEFGIGAGIHWVELSAFMKGDVSVGGGGNTETRESARGSLPLPNVGIWYMHSISPKWAFKARFDWLDVSYDIYSGTLTNASIGLNYRLSNNFGAGLSYNLLDLDYTVKDSDWRGRAVLRYEGLYAHLTVFW